MTRRYLIAACAGLTALACADGAPAQTFGFAAMQPGTINHTTSSAISTCLLFRCSVPLASTVM